jgi:glycosyltransferase involved in cell wall biosynthesis
MRRNLVTIVGIDTVRQKTLYQTRWLKRHGFEVHVLTLHRDPGSITEDDSARIEEARVGAGARIRQFAGHLRAHRRRLHHVELYVAGRFAFVYALMCRLARVKLLAVERGDLHECQRRVYPLTVRLSIYACYRLANCVWLKEPYMERAFSRWRVRNTFLLPNAVPVPDAIAQDGERDIDFLWANRLVPERNPEWFADAVAGLAERREVSASVLGFSVGDPGPRVAAVERAVRQKLGPVPSLHCEPFGDPEPSYRRARFFVLPSDYVFGNFALLEAMAHGVVPIVSNVEGTERLIDSGRNGFAVTHDPRSFAAALEDALDLPEPAWELASQRARETVAEHFSLDGWGQRLLQRYEALA